MEGLVLVRTDEIRTKLNKAKGALEKILQQKHAFSVKDYKVKLWSTGEEIVESGVTQKFLEANLAWFDCRINAIRKVSYYCNIGHYCQGYRKLGAGIE
jgi:hypothetical protein